MIRRLLYTMDPQQGGEKEEYFTTVKIQNPITEETENGDRYTSYEILLESNDIAFTLPQTSIRRRFSDFLWLRKQLADNEPEISPPLLPPKSFFRSRFNKSLIQFRQQKLQEFLESVIKIPSFLGDSSLHLFLQTPLSTTDMEECLNGQKGMSVLYTVLEYGNAQLHANSFGYDSGVELSGNSHSCSINDSQHTWHQVSPAQCIFSPTRPRSPVEFFPNCDHSTPTENCNLVADILVHETSPVVTGETLPVLSDTQPQIPNLIQRPLNACGSNYGEEPAVFHEKTNHRISPSSDTDSAPDSDNLCENDSPQADEPKTSDRAYGSLDTLLSSVNFKEMDSNSCGSTTSLERAAITGKYSSSKLTKSRRRVTFSNEVTVAQVIDKFTKRKRDKPASDRDRIHVCNME